MPWQTIKKRRDFGKLTPNLTDYEQFRAHLSWDQVRQELPCLPEGGGLNIAFAAVDHHAAGPRRDHLALRWLSKNGLEPRMASSLPWSVG